jgi:hypothetical protein
MLNLRNQSRRAPSHGTADPYTPLGLSVSADDQCVIVDKFSYYYDQISYFYI